LRLDRDRLIASRQLASLYVKYMISKEKPQVVSRPQAGGAAILKQ
jgi:hypothetical protein